MGLGVVLALLVTGARAARTRSGTRTPPPGDRHDEPPLSNDDAGVIGPDGGIIVPNTTRALRHDEPDAGTLPEAAAHFPSATRTPSTRRTSARAPTGWRIKRERQQPRD